MDITKSQKLFEDKYHKGLIHGVARLSDGEYASEFTRAIFRAWHAGRESLEVDLPELCGDGENDTDYIEGLNDGIIQSARAIHTAGIRIKGESE